MRYFKLLSFIVMINNSEYPREIFNIEANSDVITVELICAQFLLPNNR